MSTTEARTIIKTETPGWYEDPATGKKTRKSDGDRVMTRAEYDQMVLDQEPAITPEAMREATEQTMREQARDKAVEQAAKDVGGKVTTDRTPTAKPEATPVTLTSGKVVFGATVEIRCAWVDPDKRTPAQEKLFAGDPRKITYEAVKAAADGKRSAMPDGSKRVIKKQDAFQVRFSVENQAKWRAELRRRKNKARREAARKAAKA